ncbi:Endonuclease/exonuclease/phosphatase, partial [Suillus americanus]
MRGRWHNGTDKWLHINQIVREKKIGILALQETHLTKNEEAILNETFQQRLCIISLIDPMHTNAKGVALVLNKQLTNSREATSRELVPGHAILITLPWHNKETLNVLAVYAPNNPQSNQLFWTEVHEKLDGLPLPDIMLGDFNIVKDALDRLPPKQDNQNATEALLRLKLSLDLRDGWCFENPKTVMFTCAQSATQGGRQSRIDHIYINEEFMPFSKEWQIEASGIATDHQLVSARISTKKMPFIGKGRWTLPMFILKDESVSEEIISMGREMHAQIIATKSNRTESNNPQLIFSTFKSKSITLCRDATKRAIPKIKNHINSLRKNLKLTLENQNLPEDERCLVGLELQE